MTYSPLTPRLNALETADFSNHWINGGFDIWQKQFTFTTVTDGLLTADRHRVYKNGTMVYDVNRDTSDFPTFAQAGYQFAASLRVNGDSSFITSIPNDPDNRDWRIFQAWLAEDEANVPDEAE